MGQNHKPNLTHTGVYPIGHRSKNKCHFTLLTKMASHSKNETVSISMPLSDEWISFTHS